MVSRLEELCGFQVAIELASKLEFRNEILRLLNLDVSDDVWQYRTITWFENMEKKVLDALENLPVGLIGKIPIPVVIYCLIQSIEWAKFHNEEFYLPFDYSCSFLRSSLFTSKGILDEEKAAREIIKDTELSSSLKFCIACHYCLSDVIPVLWEQLPEDKRPRIQNEIYCNRFCIGVRNEMADLWSYFLLGELQILMEEEDDSFSLYKFKKTFDNDSYRNFSDVAFKKCFEELNESEKEEAAIFAREQLNNFLSNIETFGYCKSDTNPVLLFLQFQKYLEMAIFLLRHLDERQLMVFFQPLTLHYVLFHLLSWPYQHMFMDIVNQFFEVLPKTGFCLLLHRIVTLMKNEWSSKLCHYHNILRDFWVQSSPSLKRIFFSLEGMNKRDMYNVFTNEEREDYFIYDLLSDFEHFDNSYVICELFESPFTIEDENIIQLIFSSATLEEKSKIVRLQGNRIGEISFKACDLRRIDLFIECCVPKERIQSFKKELFNDDDVKDVLFSLVLYYDKGKAFQNILNWAFSAEEIKEWLKNVLCVRQQWIYTLYTCKEVKCIDKVLEWALSSNEIKIFKKSLVLDVGNIVRYFKSSISRGIFQYINNFLKLIFSSEIESLVKFKKDFAFEMVHHMDESFINDLSLLKKLIEWGALSEEESKDFKRQVAIRAQFVEQRRKDVEDEFNQWVERTEKMIENQHNIWKVRSKREFESN